MPRHGSNHVVGQAGANEDAGVARRESGPEDVAAIQQLASRLWPQGWHPGGLGWALSRGRLADEVVVFDGDDGLAGWGARSGVHQPGELLGQVEPSRPDVAQSMVAWFLESAESPRLEIEVADGEATLTDALRAVGFVRSHQRPEGMVRPAGGHPGLGVEPGYQVRATRVAEVAARVDVHRRAWRPASLPWSDGRDVDPDAESPFNAEEYEAVRRTWLYDADLDLVAVAPDSTLAGCCIAWFDPTSGVAEIEPLSVVPEHRRKGLAVALCLEVAARVHKAGGRELFINTGVRPEYPAPSGAYTKAGFAVVDRATTYVRDTGS